MPVSSPLQRLRLNLIQAVYAAQCAACNRRGSWVCSSCEPVVPRLKGAGCNRCGAEKAELCDCPSIPGELASLSGVFPLIDWPKAAVHRFKYEGERVRAPHLAMYMRDLVEAHPAVDLLVPVPLHRDRLRHRGYNQALLLAEELSRITGVPTGQALTRPVRRPQQVGLHVSQRWAAVKDVFACPDPKMVAGKNILVIDDVITTGATVSNCAITVTQAGALSVAACSFARG